MEDILQNLFDLAVDSSTPWWLKAAIAAAGTSGVLYLRARRQRDPRCLAETRPSEQDQRLCQPREPAPFRQHDFERVRGVACGHA